MRRVKPAPGGPKGQRVMCEAFNAICDVGDPVQFRRLGGEVWLLTTASAAFIVDGRASIRLQGVHGYVALDRVTPGFFRAAASPRAPAHV